MKSRRYNRLQAIASDAEREALRLIAAKLGLGEAEALRTVVRERAQKMGVWETALERFPIPTENQESAPDA